MVRICPSCGTRAVDDQSQFCNKCGYPFPREPQRAPAAAARTNPRMSDTVTMAAPAPRPRPPAPAPAPSPKPGRKAAGGKNPLPFRSLLIEKRLKLIYWLGQVAIVLLALLGIGTAFTAAGSDVTNQSFINTAAFMSTPGTSPIFWICVLIFGSLAWRIFCEMAAVVSRLNDALGGGDDGDGSGSDSGYEESWGDETMIACPRCGKVVPAAELRECEHCGVQGCSSCVRKMGLLKKTLTCKDCFENK